MQHLKLFIKKVGIVVDLLKKTGTAFTDDNGIKLSASLSYYTLFSMGPTIIIIISVAGAIYGRDAIRGEIYSQLNDLVGNSAALQIQEIIKNVNYAKNSVWASIIGIFTLILGATGVFLEIQDSINTIWALKTKPKKGLIKLVLNRLVSFSMVVSLGFLLLVSLIINTLLDLLSNRLAVILADYTVYIFYVINFLVIFSIITLLFAAIFKVLPDGHLDTKDTLLGAGFTAFLFMVGKFLISFYLSRSSIATTYGSASSIVLILVWVYYSSIILYFGAEFTKVYAMEYGGKIEPKTFAVRVERQEVVIQEG